MNLDYCLKHTRKKNIDKLTLAGDILEAGKWLTIPEQVIDELKELDANGSEYAYMLLNIRERALNNLKYCAHVNSLMDILKMKKLLQKEYIENNHLDEISKIQLLSKLSSIFIGTEDEEFFLKILDDIFKNENIYFLGSILRNIYDALNYIENIKSNSTPVLKQIIGNDGETSKILYKGNSLYDNIGTRISSLKALKYIDSSKVIFLKQYKIINPLFSLISDVPVEAEMVFNFSEHELNFEILCDDESLLKIESYEYKKLARDILKLLKEYTKRMKQMYLSNSKNQDDSTPIITKQNSNIVFSMHWSKKYHDYYINIGKNKNIKVHPIELVNLFQQLFLFITIYTKMSNNICLKNNLELSNKDFSKLIGVEASRGNTNAI